MRSEKRNIETLKLWDKNPRTIAQPEFQKLCDQIVELGQYKPLLILEDGTVLGGNMRFKAYKELGMTDIWVSVVTPKNDEELLKYALSDNDMVGKYDKDAVHALISETGVDMSKFTLSGGTSLALEALMSQTPREQAVKEETADAIPNIYKIQFSFPMDEFKSVMERLYDVIITNDLSDNTEAFLFLMKQYENGK